MHTPNSLNVRKLYIIVGFCLLAIAPVSAQITWTTGYTADSLAGYLAGPGVEIDNAIIDCHNLAIGMFDCVDCNVGIDSGVVLTTGRVSNIAGPNNSGSTGTNNGWPGDPDLNAYPGVGTTNDACALEFDVFSPGDSLRFEYVFGSEEYPEYVFSINDAFIFMLSGPGYPTPTNIALIPGTALPVTIDNVNATTNPAYYIANGTGGTGIYATSPYYIEYDGFTVVMTAEAVVTPCEWYHLKLVIGDESDFVWDSGVFLKAGSLTTNLLADFTYGGVPFGGTAEFCSTDPDPSPTYATGALAGEFSAEPAGLVFDATTGVIDVSASDPGSYTFTNTLMEATCYGDTTEFAMTVNIYDPPAAGFNYLGAPYCSNDPDPSPLPMLGATLGTFSATPAGLVINPLTGTIDLSASTPGTYVVTNFVASGTVCPDNSATYTVTIYPTYASTVNADFCLGDGYLLPDGTTVFTGGTYVSNLLSVHGCDSIITTNLISHPVYNFTLNPAICSGTTYTLPDGTAVGVTGTYVNNFTSVWGCDSNYTVNLTVSPIATINVTEHICDDETFTLPDGTVVNTTGVYPVTLTTAAGCDSTINTTLFVHPTYAITQNPIICDDATYTLPDGLVVNTTGVYISNLLTTKGCDSIITTNLIVNPTYDIIQNPEICIGETYTLDDGSTTTTGGTWVYPYTTINGCDSVITINLTVNPLPVISWPIDDIYCLEQGTILMEATPPGGTYSGPGISGPNFVTATAGVGGPYTLTYEVTDANGCYNSMTVTTSVDDNFVTAWGDTTVYYGEDAMLYSTTGGDYNWYPTDGIECSTCPETVVLPPYSIDYVMTSVDENGCTASDFVVVTVLPTPPNDVYIPNTFTPNGDNINDLFYVYGFNVTTVISFEIFDRWGSVVYRGTNMDAADPSLGWDGTIQGDYANNGVYAYMIEVEFDNGQRMKKAGNITLIR